jgi:hypothetical protein
MAVDPFTKRRLLARARVLPARKSDTSILKSDAATADTSGHTDNPRHLEETSPFATVVKRITRV